LKKRGIGEMSFGNQQQADSKHKGEKRKRQYQSGGKRGWRGKKEGGEGVACPSHRMRG